MSVKNPPPVSYVDYFLDATTQISIWSNVEANLGITAGSLVTVRPFLRIFGTHNSLF